MHIFSFSFVHFWSSVPLGVWGTYKKLEHTTHTLYIRSYSTVRRGGSREARDFWWGRDKWCGKQHRGVGKVLAKGRATTETQQGEIDRSVHTFLYHPAGLPLFPAHFGVTTNYIVSLKNWSPNKRRSSVILKESKNVNYIIFFDFLTGMKIVVPENFNFQYPNNFLSIIFFGWG